MVFKATFNNISVISCWLVLLLEVIWVTQYTAKSNGLPQVA